MREFKTDLFDNEPPFACCLFHKETKPQEQNFLDMMRLTFFPHFQLYSFTFFWLILIIFVFIYSLSIATDVEYLTTNQFLRVSQRSLFILGENYPYYLIKKGNYYRLITSTVLFRNLYHFLIASIGIISFGSYIQQIVGFKRILLLSITTGVGGEVIHDVFQYQATVQSLTPICGLIGFMLGYFIVKSNTKWKYHSRQKIHMIVVMTLMFLLYLQLGIIYRNLSWFSMFSAFLLGLIFFFCDPNDDYYQRYRICFIILIIAIITLALLLLFLNTNPPLIYP